MFPSTSEIAMDIQTPVNELVLLMDPRDVIDQDVRKIKVEQTSSVDDQDIVASSTTSPLAVDIHEPVQQIQVMVDPLDILQDGDTTVEQFPIELLGVRPPKCFNHNFKINSLTVDECQIPHTIPDNLMAILMTGLGFFKPQEGNLHAAHLAYTTGLLPGCYFYSFNFCT